MRAKAPVRLIAALSLVSLTAGCFMVVPVPLGTTAAPSATNAPQPDSCGAAGLQDLIGQPKSALNGRDLAPVTRVILPGQPVTMDSFPERLNVWIDDNGRISSVICG